MKAEMQEEIARIEREYDGRSDDAKGPAWGRRLRR